jgi:hypothetical protein
MASGRLDEWLWFTSRITTASSIMVAKPGSCSSHRPQSLLPIARGPLNPHFSSSACPLPTTHLTLQIYVSINKASERRCLDLGARDFRTAHHVLTFPSWPARAISVFQSSYPARAVFGQSVRATVDERRQSAPFPPGWTISGLRHYGPPSHRILQYDSILSALSYTILLPNSTLFVLLYAILILYSYSYSPQISAPGSPLSWAVPRSTLQAPHSPLSPTLESLTTRQTIP